jgi:hypothetical protein
MWNVPPDRKFSFPRGARGVAEEVSMYALFRGETQIARTYPTEREVWEAALLEGLITDVPVADEADGQVLPPGYHVEQVEENYDPQPDWKLPREIS